MEKFSLKFKDFTSNVHNFFQNLRKEEDFFDITLVGDDCKYVTAHKLVLASSSEYFKMVISNHNKYLQSHAVICLEGLNQTDLNNVLDYIYHGEIQIYQQDLDRFLAIAERLKLEGLVREWDQPDDEDDCKSKPIEPGEMKMRKNFKAIEKPVITIDASHIQSLEELDQKVKESFYKDSDGSYVCHHCSYTITSSRNMTAIKGHVETHFEGLSFSCTNCDKILKSRHSLRMHKRRIHSEVA